jgi:hypothetical protein
MKYSVCNAKNEGQYYLQNLSLYFKSWIDFTHIPNLKVFLNKELFLQNHP